MEPKDRLVLEVVLAAVFVVFLVVLSIVVVNASEGSSTETTITNSFNTYNYDIPAQTRYEKLTTKPYIIDDGKYARVYPSRVVFSNDRDYKKRYGYDHDRKFSYDSWSQLRIAEGLFGNSINNYEVYVRNREYTGGYFKVVFYFEDYYGDVGSEAMTHYIGPREESRFVFKDISPSRYEYRNWWYEVIPISKKDSFYVDDY